MNDIISPKIQVLAQITIDEKNQLSIGTKLPKEQLLNLFIDAVKLLVNQKENKIITP